MTIKVLTLNEIELAEVAGGFRSIVLPEPEPCPFPFPVTLREFVRPPIGYPIDPPLPVS